MHNTGAIKLAWSTAVIHVVRQVNMSTAMTIFHYFLISHIELFNNYEADNESGLCKLSSQATIKQKINTWFQTHKTCNVGIKLPFLYTKTALHIFPKQQYLVLYSNIYLQASL